MFLRTLILTLALALCALAKPNYSGNWKMDPGKSDFGPMPAPTLMERRVNHEDPKLEVSTRQSGQQGEISTELKYTTDGKESINTIRGVEVKSVAKWDGDDITIEYKRSTPNGEVSISERWKLAGEGKVFTVTMKVAGGFGEFEAKMHFDKQ